MRMYIFKGGKKRTFEWNTTWNKLTSPNRLKIEKSSNRRYWKVLEGMVKLIISVDKTRKILDLREVVSSGHDGECYVHR